MECVRRIVGRRHEPFGCSGDVLRHARRRVGPPRRQPRCRRPRFAQHADGPGSRRARRIGRARRPRRAGSGVRRPRPRARWHARRAVVHQWDGGRQLPPGRRRGRAVERADDRRHGRSPARVARRRGRPDHRSERPLRRCGALVSRSRHRRRRRIGQLALARATLFRRRGDRPGAPQPAVPRAVPRRGRRAAAASLRARRSSTDRVRLLRTLLRTG